MNTIKIDIVLVCYNQEKYISQALESILMQQLSNNVSARVVVADDYSQDETLEIIRSYEDSSKFPFVYLPSERNMGITRNYQRIFDFCDADYVAILEGDDWWCNTKRLQYHINFLEEHRECVMSANRAAEYDDAKQQYFQMYNHQVHTNTYSLVSFDDMLQNHYASNFSCHIYRGSVLKKINPKMYDVNVPNVDDWLVALELSQHGIIAIIPQIWNVYRYNEHGFWSALSIDKKEQDSLNRVYAYNEYFQNKYSDTFHIHAKAIQREYNEIRERLLKENSSKFTYSLHIIKQKCLRFIKRIVAFFLPPKTIKKLKSRTSHDPFSTNSTICI